MHYFSQLFNYEYVEASGDYHSRSTDNMRSHPWSHVVIGMWHKYPNSHCSHVVSVDVIDRSVDPETGIIRTERILGCKQKAPAWVLKVRPPFRYFPSAFPAQIPYAKLFGGSEDAFVREVSFVDPAAQDVTVTSINMSLSQFATCNEFIRYSPAGQSRTQFVQTAEIESRMTSWRILADKVEDWLVQRFEQNAQLGKMGFNEVLRTLREQSDRQLAHA
jgi:hypothetical protein